ncbi:iron-containing redox enzyme family protein [Aliikangiella marina]|uniref:Iron-containing redox enzyme family protein n=1 Tax=Aliikangiella marina TaxID=1712262 RepID=A0A545TDS2_9GAMM|nr:iron-containing redox enzyme family protein [Aliikangiella marina]TQV75369.1 iron-containing redox enzyme family protein [Aliikangiella marina]
MLLCTSQPSHSQSNAQHFIADLNQEALEHRAVNHPYLTRLASGSFTDPSAVLKDFAFQYLAYSQDFLRYLTATISKLESRQHRDWLVENLIEESGHIDEHEAKELTSIGIKMEWVQGVPHPLLFMRFLDAIGYDKSYRKQNDFSDEAKIWSHMFLNACSAGSAAQSLGAMGLGTENIVKYIYKPILQAIKNFLNVSEKDRVFFDLHALLDDEHGEIINNIAVEYARYDRHREMIREGMLMALNLRAGFFDAMMIRADTIVSQPLEAKAS